jgi:hypothetical protein
VWVNHFKDPKTKQVKFYNIYGGKLAGILTQSLCRQIFFRSLSKIKAYADTVSGLWVVGQFHDEIVLDWSPGSISLPLAKGVLETHMSSTELKGFPLTAEIKDDYRYTK